MCYKFLIHKIESHSSMESNISKSSRVTKDSSATKTKSTEKDKTKSKEKSSSKDKDKSKSKEKPTKEKEKPKLKEKSSSKDKSVESKSKKVVLPLPKLKKPSGKVKNHDDVPISGIKGAAKKSWWEMDGCVPDVYTKVVDAQNSIESKSKLKEDKSSKKGASSVQSYSKNGSCENVSKVSSSRGRGKSSPVDVENDEEIQKRGRTLRGINTRNQDLNETSVSNISYKTANSNLSNISNEENSAPIAKPPPFQFKGAAVRGRTLNNSGFGAGFKDDKPVPESRFQTRNLPNRRNQQQEEDYEEDYEAPQRSSNPPRGPISRPSAPRFGGRCEDNDDFQSTSLPSRPTNVPSGGPVGSGPVLSPRPKFTRPMPLKRGAGAIYAKAAPVIRTPEEIMKGLLDKISKLEENKYNDHTKFQKELIEAILKNPHVLGSFDADLIVKTARKICEVAATNRTNLSRSSMICLGYMFQLIPQILSPLIMEAIALCAKKGVSSSPEHLIIASNFCLGKICLYCNEFKVSQQLVSVYRNNKSYQIMALNALVVLMDRLGPNMLKLKNMEGIVDVSVKGITGGGVPTRTAGRNILGMIKEHAKLDHYLNMCKATEIAKKTVQTALLKYDEDAKNYFVEEYCKEITL